MKGEDGRLRYRAEAARENALSIGTRNRALQAGFTAQDRYRESRLSRRETQVLRLLSSGITTKGIAFRVGISPNTVNYHLANIYRKLGVHSRVEAANAFRIMIAQLTRDMGNPPVTDTT